jgi:hypothetical protein
MTISVEVYLTLGSTVLEIGFKFNYSLTIIYFNLQTNLPRELVINENSPDLM